MTKNAMDVLADKVRDLIVKARDERRNLNDSEREELKQLTKRMVEIEANEIVAKSGVQSPDLQARIDAAGNGIAGGDLYGAFKSAGWEPGKRTSIPGFDLKTVGLDVGTTGDELSSVRVQGAPLGADRRFISSIFPGQNTGDALAVDIVRQSNRVMPLAADVQRDPLDQTPKAEVTSNLEAAHVPMGQLAAVSSDISNALLTQAGVRSIVNQDLALAIQLSEDDAIVDGILAAAPATAGAPGVDLTAQIIYARADMSDDGYSGSVVALNPLDYAELQLLRGDAERFAREDPLRNFRFVESNSITLGSPLLIDPAAAGRKYEGALTLASFEQDAGQTNLSTVRLEKLFLFAVERVAAIRIVGLGS